MTCPDARFRHTAGPYLLGTLDEAERAAYQKHLAICPACRADVDHMRPVVAMLDAVPSDDIEAMEATHTRVPDTLLPGLLERAARRSRRRRLAFAGMAALAAAAIVALAVVIGIGGPSSQAQQVTVDNQLAMIPRHDSPIRATAELRSVPWGTQITVRCHYESDAHGSAYPDAKPSIYTLQVDGVAGSAHDIGSWSVSSGSDTEFTSGTALQRNKIKHIEVVAADGTVVLRAAG